MKFFGKKILALAVCSAAVSQSAYGQEPASITEAIKAAKTQLNLRFRYEDVEEETLEDAAATTLRTRLTYTSGLYEGFGLTLEMDDTSELGKQDYSDGVTNRGTAVIADPEITEVNQSFISYTKGATTAKYGRQRIILDNQRFVGGVGWRQDEQTFDAFTVSSKPVTEVSLFYAYVTDVNRIFAEFRDHNHETHLLNAKYDSPFGSIIGYGYLLEDKSFQTSSSDTFGLRWQGKAGSVITYNLEYAKQKEAGENPTNYSADYTLAEILASIPSGSFKTNIKSGYEILGSDGGTAAFSTPLATLHAFQGWADRFIGAPDAPLTAPSGIKDAYAGIGAAFSNFSFGIEYHTYKSDEGDIDYGEEFGLVADTKLGVVGLTFKYADYSSDLDAGTSLFSRDASKLWVMASVTF